jgi:hypothetical protein
VATCTAEGRSGHDITLPPGTNPGLTISSANQQTRLHGRRIPTDLAQHVSVFLIETSYLRRKESSPAVYKTQAGRAVSTTGGS